MGVAMMAKKKMLFVMLVGRAKQFDAHISKVFFANFSDYELVRCLDVKIWCP